MRRHIRSFVGLCSAGVLLDAAPCHALDEALYAELLSRHTRAVPDIAGTRVDYSALRDSRDWVHLIESLSRSDPARLRSREEQLAFWVNAYNILAIDVVRTHYPVKSIKDVGSLLRPVWKRRAGTIAGRGYSLDEIEHGILRPMGEPRVHVAVVCASLSCPPLLREPWNADRIEAQLDDAMRRWLADPRKGLRLDRNRRTVAMSRIFDWFAEDFDKSGGALEFALPFLDAADRDWIRSQRNALRIAYLDYDWGLNDLAGTGRSSP